VFGALSSLLVGRWITEPAGDTAFRNAVVAWAPDGRVVARYDKVHRVPLCEYVPGRSFVRHLVNLDNIPRDAIAGRGPGLLRTPAGPLGVVISFEVFFSNRARAAIRAGGQVLVVPTNTASYTTSQVPASELATARLRAWETGRDVVMAAPTGFSAVLGPRGRIRLRTGLSTQQVLVATVERRVGLTLTAARLADDGGLAFTPCDRADAGLFARTLEATYAGTLDCPEVNGVRTVEEIIAGHRCQGLHDPERWWLALDDGRPVAVLLATELPESDGWDLAYLGVVPESRRRGVGRQLTRKAILEAREAEAGQLLLSVDARNRPAWQLYRGLGFEPYDHREVYLAIRRPVSAAGN